MFTEALIHFTTWLTGGRLNIAIASHSWVVPALQTVHILSVAIVLAGVLLINLRVAGWAERSQSIPAVLDRFLGPITIAVAVLLITGLLQIVGEPNRAIFRSIFWIKMALLLAAFALTWSHRPAFTHAGGARVGIGRKALAIAALLLWVAVIVAGRWIAYADAWAGAPS